MQHAAPRPQDILNLRNWIEGNPYLARHITEYIIDKKSENDLISLVVPQDGALARVEILIKDSLTKFLPSYYRVSDLIYS
jgi:hypothetical protein